MVIDAKYRLDDSPAALRRYGGPAPPAEALLTLHRYRDAVPHADCAVALYPARASDWRGANRYEESRLWRSISGGGVGAVPLLPGSEGALTALLREWIGV
jgi:hypothetical protein